MTSEKDPRTNRWPVPDGEGPSRCRSCGAAIVWTLTSTGRRVPLSLTTEPTVVNGKAVPASVVIIDGETWAYSHFANCPDAKSWSKKGA